MSTTIFGGVIANFVIQNINYEKLNLLSKLISKFYIQLQIKIEISITFRWSMFIKFCMHVEDSNMYGFHKN